MEMSSLNSNSHSNRTGINHDDLSQIDSSHVDEPSTDCTDCTTMKTEETGRERLISSQAANGNKIVVHCTQSRPPHYLVLSMLVSVVNPVFGGLAVLFSLLSQREGRLGDIESAKEKGTTAKWLNIVGLAVFIVIVAFLVVYFVYIKANIVDSLPLRQSKEAELQLLDEYEKNAIFNVSSHNKTSFPV